MSHSGKNINYLLNIFAIFHKYLANLEFRILLLGPFYIFFKYSYLGGYLVAEIYAGKRTRKSRTRLSVRDTKRSTIYTTKHTKNPGKSPGEPTFGVE